MIAVEKDQAATTDPCLWWRLGRVELTPSIFVEMGLFPVHTS